MTTPFDPVTFDPENWKDEHRQFTDEEIREIDRRFAIDRLSPDADYDVANFVYNHIGILDIDTLRVKLSTEICSMLMRRSFYWIEKSHSSEELWKKERCNIKSNNISTIAQKLKTAKYKNIIIKEYKSIVKYYSNQTQQPH